MPLTRLLRRLSVALAAAVSACAYGFSGGGLPTHVRTVAVIPFSNETASPEITREVTDALREGLGEAELQQLLLAGATAPLDDMIDEALATTVRA